jgi:hypothetical protein
MSLSVIPTFMKPRESDAFGVDDCDKPNFTLEKKLSVSWQRRKKDGIASHTMHLTGTEARVSNRKIEKRRPQKTDGHN